ncbi:MAG: hypothetical protein PHP53_20540 [Prolixibacteraceae bacterium]|nr:hypothetical protein [Prolixibacteraceae bacterium]
MKKYTKYKFLPELNLTLCNFQGDINQYDMTDYMKYLHRDDDYNIFSDLIFDFRDVNFSFTGKGIDEVAQYFILIAPTSKIKTYYFVYNNNSQRQVCESFVLKSSKSNHQFKYIANIEQLELNSNFDESQIELIEETLKSIKKLD